MDYDKVKKFTDNAQAPDISKELQAINYYFKHYYTNDGKIILDPNSSTQLKVNMTINFWLIFILSTQNYLSIFH